MYSYDERGQLALYGASRHLRHDRCTSKVNPPRYRQNPHPDRLPAMHWPENDYPCAFPPLLAAENPYFLRSPELDEQPRIRLLEVADGFLHFSRVLREKRSFQVGHGFFHRLEQTDEFVVFL